MNFDDAVQIVLSLEGGHVNDPNDPGGETKYGISKRAHPDMVIELLSVEQAKQIYRESYWQACRCDDLPSIYRLMVFDCAVNQGASRARRILQQAVGTVVDGDIGPITLDATHSADPSRALVEYASQRMILYSRAQFCIFGLGWSRRLFFVFSETLAELKEIC